MTLCLSWFGWREAAILFSRCKGTEEEEDSDGDDDDVDGSSDDISEEGGGKQSL